MRRVVYSIFPIYLGAVLASAAEVVYVTDLSIFTSLAPCAANALSYNIQSQTYNNCPEAVTDLQSCVCTKNQNLASISTAISKSVSYSCGSTASEDQASAATVLSAYCNQDSIPSFPTPATPVSVYITDIPEISLLAPCASYAVSAAVQTLTWDLCPPDATALATCACNKNQNSLKVSQLINSSARYSCASHTADISSAQAIFAAYCALNSGTSAFPTPTNPPGDMTYYVTALTEYSSLAPCAASGLSYAVFSQTWDYCPGGPQALASCACIKESMSGSLTSSISSNVKYSCSSTATEDVASAIAVFDFYCSAARAEVVAAGVTDSVAQTYPTAATGNSGGSGSGGARTTTTKKGGASGTSSPTGAPANDGGASGNDNSNGPKPAVIGGAIAGVVVGLLGLGTLIWFLVKQSRKKQADAAALAATHANLYSNGPDHDGKPELAGDPINTMPPPSPSPSTLKPNPMGRTGSVSPVSAHGGSGWTPPPNKAELQGQYAPYPPMPPNAAELAGQGQQGSPYMPPNRSELMGGQGYPLQSLPSPNRPELMNQQSGGYETHPNRPELMGQQGYPQGYQQGQAYPMRAQEYNAYDGGQQHPQEAHGQPIYEVPGQQGPYQQPVYEASSIPVAGHGQQPQQQQPQSGWPIAEMEGRYGQAR
ncbi:hypothetical protein CONLIGDRAFT_684907 [Coniochaeta ligniaria NRRL 30616]|uniref:Extracellular membrane protein CFEM domain-containing protein n=1 Tax=Coniochaeta ligniaria NRRL 30616 TaxID=1408157 RepID=A0A1J7IC45_9PEZI|nr:hypothetical protein CONLIGDRAFT_684907 [Coniochaeta ligniaria NRRL 30616]